MAAYHDPGSGEDVGEEYRRADRKNVAELALLVTPVPFSWALTLKWGVIEGILAEEREAGKRIWPILVLGLAALKADVLTVLDTCCKGDHQ